MTPSRETARIPGIPEPDPDARTNPIWRGTNVKIIVDVGPIQLWVFRTDSRWNRGINNDYVESSVVISD